MSNLLKLLAVIGVAWLLAAGLKSNVEEMKNVQTESSGKMASEIEKAMRGE